LTNAVLNRSPDDTGLSWYTNQLQAGKSTLQSIALDVLSGATGSDLATINTKLQAAKQATNSFHLVGADHSYSGTNAADTARQYMSSVTSSTTVDQIDSGTTNLVKKLFANTITVPKVSDLTFHSSDTHTTFSLDATSQNLGNYKTTYGIKITNLSDGFTEKTYDFLPTGSTSITSAATNKSGVLAISTSKSVLLHTQGNDNYATVQLNSLGNANDSLTKVVATASGNFLAFGTENSVANGHDAYAVVLDTAGQKVAERRFEDTSSISPNDSFTNGWALANGQYVLERSNYKNYGKSYYVTDANLNLQSTFSFTYGSAIKELVDAGNGSYIGLTDRVLVFFDQNFNVTTTSVLQYQGSSNYGSFADIAVSGGNLYALANTPDGYRTLLAFDGIAATAKLTDVKVITDRQGGSVSSTSLQQDNGNSYLFGDYPSSVAIVRNGAKSTTDVSSNYKINEVALSGGLVSAASYYYANGLAPSAATTNTGTFQSHDITLVGNANSNAAYHFSSSDTWGTTYNLGGLQ